MKENVSKFLSHLFLQYIYKYNNKKIITSWYYNNLSIAWIFDITILKQLIFLETIFDM